MDLEGIMLEGGVRVTLDGFGVLRSTSASRPLSKMAPNAACGAGRLVASCGSPELQLHSHRAVGRKLPA